MANGPVVTTAHAKREFGRWPGDNERVMLMEAISWRLVRRHEQQTEMAILSLIPAPTPQCSDVGCIEREAHVLRFSRRIAPSPCGSRVVAARQLWARQKGVVIYGTDT